MAVPLVVPDASVILKWVLPPNDEPESDRARILRKAIVEEDVRALVPALWLYEVGNTLARRFPDEAARLLAALMKLELDELAPSRKWLEAVLKLTRGHGVTFYDAAYHAIAVMHKGNFVTADERYANQVVDVGSIVLLRDWSQTP
jgi:predicted nucleic acid-binding protein